MDSVASLSTCVPGVFSISQALCRELPHACWYVVRGEAGPCSAGVSFSEVGAYSFLALG